MRGRRDRDADDVLAGRRPEGRERAGTDGLLEFVAVLHASREVEPPPRMSARLRAQIVGTGSGPEARRRRGAARRVEAEARVGAVHEVDGVLVLVGGPGGGPDDRRRSGDAGDVHPGPARVRRRWGRRPPAHLSPTAVRSLVRAQQRRAAVSVAAAAALLAGLVLAAHRPPGEQPADDGVSGLGSRSGAGMRPPEAGATPSDPADALTPPGTSGATPAGEATPGAVTSTGPAPASPSDDPAGTTVTGVGDDADAGIEVPAFDPPTGRGDGNRDGDRDGDGDGTGTGRGSGDEGGPGGDAPPSSSGRDGRPDGWDEGWDEGGGTPGGTTPPTSGQPPSTLPTRSTTTTSSSSTTTSPPTVVDPRGELTPAPPTMAPATTDPTTPPTGGRSWDDDRYEPFRPHPE